MATPPPHDLALAMSTYMGSRSSQAKKVIIIFGTMDCTVSMAQMDGAMANFEFVEAMKRRSSLTSLASRFRKSMTTTRWSVIELKEGVLRKYGKHGHLRRKANIAYNMSTADILAAIRGLME